MARAEPVSAVFSHAAPKPRDEELDMFGITNPGKVRSENQVLQAIQAGMTTVEAFNKFGVM